MSSSSIVTSIRHSYEKWILHNTDSVRYIETLLKGSLFFFPGRFKEQELTSELGMLPLLLFILLYCSTLVSASIPKSAFYLIRFGA